MCGKRAQICEAKTMPKFGQSQIKNISGEKNEIENINLGIRNGCYACSVGKRRR